MPSSPVALVLAAGFARRFGGDKRTARLADGRLVIDAVLQEIHAAGLEAVVAQNSDNPLSLDAAIRSVTIPAAVAARGMGASLSAAVRELPVERDLIVCLADMPFVQPSTYTAIATTLKPGRIVCPRHRGERGNPVGFSCSFREQLLALDGDRGARDLLRSCAQCVDCVEVDDPGIHRDIDLPDDLR